MMEAAKAGWGMSGVEASPEGSGDVKRLRRWLFNLAAWGSAVLCVATAVLWVRSYWRTDEISRYSAKLQDGVTKRDEFFINSWRGRIFLFTSISAEPGVPRPKTFDAVVYDDRWYFDSWAGEGRSPPPSTTFLGQLGFHRSGFTRNNRSLWMIAWPHWVMAMVLAIPIPLMLWPWYRERLDRLTRAEGRCVVCGYDLRATPDRCPECGRVTEVAKGVAA